jgi:hypothetical protein
MVKNKEKELENEKKRLEDLQIRNGFTEIGNQEIRELEKTEREEELRKTLNVLLEHYRATIDEKFMFNEFIGLREKDGIRQGRLTQIEDEIKFIRDFAVRYPLTKDAIKGLELKDLELQNKLKQMLVELK